MVTVGSNPTLSAGCFKIMNVNQVLELLKSQANPDQLAGMAHFAIQTDQRLGLSIYDLRRIAKDIEPDHQLALELWQSGIPDARILASMIDIPAQATDDQLEAWVIDFNSWDVCDQVCDNLFEHTCFAWDKVRAWSTREEEFVKRAAYALLACLAWHDKAAGDQQFKDCFPLIKAGATDPRNFVKKAVNWALRNIGKRNQALNQAAIDLATDLLTLGDKTANWVARDALRELQSEKIQLRLAKNIPLKNI
jgi:3-methyladenine DNA glycosylase AlkD